MGRHGSFHSNVNPQRGSSGPGPGAYAKRTPSLAAIHGGEGAASEQRCRTDGHKTRDQPRSEPSRDPLAVLFDSKEFEGSGMEVLTLDELLEMGEQSP